MMIRTFFRLVGNSCFFAGLFVVWAVGVVMISMHGIFGSVNPETIDRANLIRVMKLRDFRTLPPETVKALTFRAETEFGRQSANKPVFQFSKTDKQIYAYFQNNRFERKSLFETNLLLMSRIQYFQWMNGYASALPEQRVLLMKEVVEDMRYWQLVYMDFLRAAELPVPSMAELIREFDDMIEYFKIGATQEEIARIDDFKQRINTAYAASEIQGAVQNFSGNISATMSNMLDSFLKKPKKNEKEKKESQ
ncbi:MAG: hypothetical protein LBU34_14630 [Planctomycetaceae bacterium]|jgi:hypothetical protein|nr:hypothetical protein [Planctomycetaceae bacterium]